MNPPQWSNWNISKVQDWKVLPKQEEDKILWEILREHSFTTALTFDPKI